MAIHNIFTSAFFSVKYSINLGKPSFKKKKNYGKCDPPVFGQNYGKKRCIFFGYWTII